MDDHDHLTAAPAQPRPATVLFAIVTDLAELSQALDLEDAGRLSHELWQQLDAIITAAGGRIDRRMGDTVVAVWGAETAREDDPERAVQAALAMQEEVSRFSVSSVKYRAPGEGEHLIPDTRHLPPDTWHLTPDTRHLTLRIGIATGDTVNTAGWLAEAAPLDGILISHSTYQQVRGVFDIQAQEPLAVQGPDRPLPVYLVLRRKPRAFHVRARGVEGIATPMIGREHELAQLQAALETAMRQRQTQMVTILGEAGLGKSRLLYEFDDSVELRPEQIWYFKGRSEPARRHLPYGLLRDLFTFRFDILDSDPQTVARQKVEAGFAAVLGEGEESRMRAHLAGQLLGFDFGDSPYVRGILDDGPQIRQRATAYIAHYFAAVSQDEPALVYLEDIHWADRPSLELIQELVRRLPRQSLMIVCLARPPLLEQFPEWGQDHTRLILEPLTASDSRQLVAEILQKADHVPEALPELIVQNAEGNPFYVEELIKMLIEDGVIVTGADHWQVDSSRLGSLRLPATLTGVLQARLDGLPAGERLVLQQAAVFGRVFWDEGLAALQPPGDRRRDRSQVAGALQALRQRELIFRRQRSSFAGAQEYVFKHALLREVTYETVLKRERRLYHRQAAGWLMAHSGDRELEVAGLIAEHLELGGEGRVAARYLQQVGRRALDASAFNEAVALLERAWSLLEKKAGDDTETTRLQIMLTQQRGKALRGLGEYRKAQRWLRRGEGLARSAGAWPEVVEILNQLARIDRDRGTYDAAWQTLRESLSLAQAHADTAGQAAVLRNLGWLAMRSGVYSVARDYLEKGRALYQALDDQAGLASIYNALGTLAIMSGVYDEGIGHYRQSLALKRQLGDRLGVSAVLSNLGETARVQGDYAAARTYTEEGLEISREIGDQVGIAIALDNLGHSAAALGEDETAYGHYEAAVALALRLGVTPVALDALAGLAGVLARRGETTLALELLGLVQHHPAADEEASKIVTPTLATLRATLPADVVQSGLERGRALSLEEALARLNLEPN
ncbi:MAG: tetratricopeptide repeat protein [Chloroflexi bacterium]|nr:tetratricopeptide repeat protein [Chloroflexota bacterium]